MFRKNCLVGCTVLFFFLLCSCSQPKDYHQRTQFYQNGYTSLTQDTLITCVTYNIQCGFPTYLSPWSKDDRSTQQQLDHVVSVLASLNPDVICLQEVPLNRYNSDIKNVIQYLSGHLQMNFAFGAHGYNDPTGVWPVEGEWGNAILTKYEILDIKNVEIEYIDVWQRRSILMTELLLNNQSLYIYSLHFMWGTPNGVQNTLDVLDDHFPEKQIIMGDFNSVVSDLPELQNAGYQEAFTLFGSNETSIDMIYVNPNNFQVNDVGFISGSDTVSDHSAVYSVLHLQ